MTLSFDTVTIRVTDGTRQTVDYAPTRVYELTGTITNAIEPYIIEGIDVLQKAGERYLGRTAPAATVSPPAATPKTKAAKAASPPPPPATSDPSSLEETKVETKASDPSSLEDTGEKAADPSAVEDWAKPSLVSDQELTAHTTRRNAELGDPGKVRALIQTYKPADAPATRVWTLAEIPQEQRADYLAKLKDLK